MQSALLGCGCLHLYCSLPEAWKIHQCLAGAAATCAMQARYHADWQNGWQCEHEASPTRAMASQENPGFLHRLPACLRAFELPTGWCC